MCIALTHLLSPPDLSCPLSVLNNSVSQTEQIKDQKGTLAHRTPTVTGWAFGRASPNVISFSCGSHPGEVCIYKMLPHTFLVNGYYLCKLTHMQYLNTCNIYIQYLHLQHTDTDGHILIGKNYSTIHRQIVSWCTVSLLTLSRISTKITILCPHTASINIQSTVLRLAIKLFYQKNPLLSGPINYVTSRNLLHVLKDI